METEGPAPSDGEVGEQPDQLPSEHRIGQRADMEEAKNVRMRGLTPFLPTTHEGLPSSHQTQIRPQSIPPTPSRSLDNPLILAPLYSWVVFSHDLRRREIHITIE